MNEIIFIDAYNVMRKLRSLEEHRFLSLMSMIPALSSYEVCVIFDGVSSPEKEWNSSLMEVLFSGPKKTADTLIEERVYKEAHRERVVVVTDDRAVSNMILGWGARVWSVSTFDTFLKGLSLK